MKKNILAILTLLLVLTFLSSCGDPQPSGYSSKDLQVKGDSFYIEAGVGGSTVKLKAPVWFSKSKDSIPELYYCLDDGIWKQYPISFDAGSFTGNGEEIALAEGERVYFSGLSNYFSLSEFDYLGFEFSGKVKAGGNLMYLLNPTGIVEKAPDYSFFALFQNCKNLQTAPELPTMNVGKSS